MSADEGSVGGQSEEGFVPIAAQTGSLAAVDSGGRNRGKRMVLYTTDLLCVKSYNQNLPFSTLFLKLLINYSNYRFYLRGGGHCTLRMVALEWLLSSYFCWQSLSMRSV